LITPTTTFDEWFTKLSNHRRGAPAKWRRKLLAAYERIDQAEMVPHRDVVAFVRDRDLSGRGMGWIDVHLLDSAIVGRLQLWTAAPHFSAGVNEFGVAYRVRITERTTG
jgi:hypothetical protein